LWFSFLFSGKAININSLLEEGVGTLYPRLISDGNQNKNALSSVKLNKRLTD